jgi:dTDP-4-dehydrorhamnose reductase
LYAEGNFLVRVRAENPDSVAQALLQTQPDVAINCIGVVKQAMNGMGAATIININSLFPHRLADLCEATETQLIHISTDCVFSGNECYYSENDLPDASDLYGLSKILGEPFRPHCLTLRTSIIGRELRGQQGLLEWFLSHRGGKVRGYTGAIFSGLTTLALSNLLADLVVEHPDLHGLYHVASGSIRKYNLLMQLRDALKLDIEIEPYANRHCDRSLSARKFKKTTGYSLPTWETMLAQLAADDTPYEEWRNA